MEYLGVSISTIQEIRLPQFEKGGFPTQGQMFIAREAGPELVGNIGNKATVANNDQIIQGIRQGVYDAVSAAMRENPEDERNIIVQIGNERIYSGFGKYVNSSNNKYGTNIVKV